MAVHISVMSGKLKGIPAINTNTLSNSFCQMMALSGKSDVICSGGGDRPDCYSWSMLKGSRKNCVNKFEQNSVTLSTGYVEWADLPVFNSLWVRFHGHGELVNETHFINFLQIAERNPRTTFSLFTKRKDIVKRVLQSIEWHGSTRASGQDVFIRKIPENLILVYSNPIVGRITDKKPQYFHKVFNTTTEKSTRDNCTGQKCIECLACYQFDGNSVLIEQKKKRA